MASADLLLHPVRLRIVQCLLGDRSRTTGELRADLPDVAPATLYRHVATLHDAGLLQVVDERRVRGATERTYRLRDPARVVGPAEAASMSVDEHRQAFTAFVAGLLGDFDRYLDSGDVDLARDLVGYRQAALHLSDDEMRQLLDDLVAVVRPLLDNRPSERRTRRMFTTVLMPGR
ncbi:helix-turn-helix domain-containing protein [Nocardioides iriomotensis]|uniref:ArsR family transcriptional regulator n=1 Tax=Nocardioides iriomotensis TaxID=715784 RepID=A0A4Q5JBV4_9ACTN|nr:helix-turn-helix domain-containing protein [Nocardioides iriomotensis]RYU15568.1 ArsR family transcriptional regulator [Nocardioides iriomotensis]